MPQHGSRLDVGRRIAALRGKKSQKDLARQAGVDLSTVSRIEGGKTDPQLSNLLAIAEALGMPVHRLLDPANDSTTYLAQPELIDHRLRLGALEERVNRLTAMVQEMSDACAGRPEQAGSTPESLPQSDGK
jgi:transcriptional regulator with XRE-family HTH domain